MLFFSVCFAIDWLHLQPLNPLLDPCDSELSGLLGVPLPTLQYFMFTPEGIDLTIMDETLKEMERVVELVEEEGWQALPQVGTPGNLE